MFKLKIVLLEERIVLDAALGDVIYVDIHASGANNGSSWKNAYTDLQSALAEAASTPSDPELIKVADGTYKPGSLATDTFNIPDLTTLTGGFGGTTILSGDIGVIGVKPDNINTIVTINALNATVSMEKITIAHAFNPSTVLFGAGMGVTNGADVSLDKMIFDDNFANRSGGGLGVSGVGSTIDINKSTFTNNTATSSGGALIVTSGATDATITHSEFFNNSAASNGGAIRFADVNQITVDHSTFTDNFVAGTPTTVGNNVGGAISMVNIVAALDAIIDHSTFNNNSTSTMVSGSLASGGAIFIQTISNTIHVNIAVDHSTFTNNHAETAGGALITNTPIVAGPDWNLSI